MKILDNASLMRQEPIRNEVLPELDSASVQIAGTNGKGSTSAFISDILIFHGLKVGTYCSPHIESYNERIRINGVNISDADLEKYVNLVNEKQAGLCQSDLLFLAACEYFKAKKVDFCVFETGLGGRRDSATLIYHEFGIITHIALDHMEILGDNIAQITWEKCGIIKPGMTIISYPNDRSDIIREEAKEAFLIESGGVRLDICGDSFSLPDYGITNAKLKMMGQHQIRNCVCAILCAKEILLEQYDPCKTQKAIEQTKVFGRMSIVQESPMIIADAAHNPDGIEVLCQQIDKFPGKKVAVVSIKQGKQYLPMISRLEQSFDHLIFTKASKQTIEPSEFSDGKIIEDFEQAYLYAKNLEFDVLVFCGSFDIVRRVSFTLK